MKSSAMKQILWISVIAITSSISTAILIKSNGLQRTSRHEISTIQWTLDTPITSYTVDLPSTRLFKLQQKSERNENSHHYYDRARGVITLFLFNVELDDAGNYTLRVSTSDLTAIDTSACLFVYGDLDGQVALTVGSSAVTEGDHVELTCNFKSNSLPAAFRPNIHYSWDVESNWETIFKRLVEPDETWLAKREHGIKNNGQLLVIESVRYLDNQAIVCVGTEGGPEARETFRFSEFRHRPILKEEGKKIFSNIFHTINLDFNIDANPPVSNRSDWSFVNSNGVANSLPPSFRSSSSHFQFQLDSSVYYGNYSITLTNAVGSTTATIQVIAKNDASGVIKEISSAENPTITVILLSILLGVALSITIAAAASCMIMKSRLNRMPRGSLEVAFENIDK